MCDKYEYSSVIHGHHVYIFYVYGWKDAAVSNRKWQSIRFFMLWPIIENDTVVGHEPRIISVACNNLKKRWIYIMCYNRAHHYSSDLAQGGLEVPCKLVFNRPANNILKLQRLLQRTPKLQGITNNTIHPVDATKEECNQADAAQDHDLVFKIPILITHLLSKLMIWTHQVVKMKRKKTTQGRKPMLMVKSC